MPAQPPQVLFVNPQLASGRQRKAHVDARKTHVGASKRGHRGVLKSSRAYSCVMDA